MTKGYNEPRNLHEMAEMLGVTTIRTGIVRDGAHTVLAQLAEKGLLSDEEVETYISYWTKNRPDLTLEGLCAKIAEDRKEKAK
jgi:hypothetical protein